MRTTKRALPLDVDYDSSDDASHQRPTTPSSTTATTSSLSAEEFDPDFTQAVIDTIGPDANPRLRQIMPSLIRHVHDFVRENRITTTEWMAALELVCKTLFVVVAFIELQVMRGIISSEQGTRDTVS